MFVLLAVFVFAAQDGFSKYLGTQYSAIFITMVRYWFFAAFVLVICARKSGGIRRAAKTKHPLLQPLRGILLVSEIVIFVLGLTHVGLAMTQALFQATPLFVTILSIPILGEKVGWRRWLAVIVGLIGVLLIINPKDAEVNVYLLLPLSSALLFAIYSVATRAVSKSDEAFTSLFYAGLCGAIAITAVGPSYWTSIAPSDWPILAVLCLCGMLSHYFLIRAYDLLQAAEVQPLTYLQLVIGAVIAVVFFDETLSWNLIAGAVIVVGAGVFTIWREHRPASGTAERELTKPKLAP